MWIYLFKLLKTKVNEFKTGINFIQEDDQQYILYKYNNQSFHIIRNKCKHAGGLFRNEEGDILICNYHGWQLNANTCEYINPNSEIQDKLYVSEISDETIDYDFPFSDETIDYEKYYYVLDYSPHYPWLKDPVKNKQLIEENEFTITYYNHACVRIKCGDFIIFTDPWLIGPALLKGWWPVHKPPETWLEDISNADMIWISHFHDDHLHQRTLNEICKKNPDILIIHADLNTSIFSFYKGNLLNNVQKKDLNTWHNINNDLRYMILYDGAWGDIDTCFYLDYKGYTLFTTVDCCNPNYGILPKNPDILLSDFAAGASGFPTTSFGGKYSEKWIKNWVYTNRKMTLSHHFKKYILETNCRFYMPYAGFLSEEHPNDKKVKRLNWHNKPTDYIEYFKRTSQGLLIPIPGLEYSIKTGNHLNSIDENNIYVNYENYDFKQFTSIYDKYKNIACLNNIAGFKHYFKWCNFKNYNLVLLILELDEVDSNNIIHGFYVDFRGNEVVVSYEKPKNIEFIELIKVDIATFRYTIYEKTSWDNLYGGFQMRIARKPDLYKKDFWLHFVRLNKVNGDLNWENVILEDNIKEEHFKFFYDDLNELSKLDDLEEVEEDEFIVTYKNENYDIKDFINKHPGGRSVFSNFKNKDITNEFKKANHSSYAEELLKTFKITNKSKREIFLLYKKEVLVENEENKLIKITLLHEDNKCRCDCESKEIESNLEDYYLFDIDNIIRPYTPIYYKNYGFLSFIIKIYKHGKLTPKIDTLVENDKIILTKVAGKLTSLMLQSFKNVIYICGGSGITPLFKILDFYKQEKKYPDSLTVLNSNKTENDLIDIKIPNNINVKIINIFTSIEPRINVDKLQSLFENEDQLFILCGPDKMNSELKKNINEHFKKSSVIVL